MKPRITGEEFKERIRKTQESMREQNLDLLLCYGNEAEPQFVRYYSDYWPLFESAGVLIPMEGEPILLIGPESRTFASEYSRISNIQRVLAFRESSEPDYPGAKLETFETLINKISDGAPIRKVGIAGHGLITHSVYSEFRKQLDLLGDVEIVKADKLVSDIRVIKTNDEIECLKEAYRIAEYAMKKVIESIHVGVSENELKGIALKAIFEQGGESEGYPFWILTGDKSNQAIGRCRNKILKKGDLVQLQVSARYEGYVSTMGRAVVLGEATEYQKNLIQAGYAAQKAILDTAKAGINAGLVSKAHFNKLEELGFEDHILYGPAHGTGLMENEFPWIESTSDYLLRPNMTFCTCVYLGNDDKEVGIRIEDGFRITEDGVEIFSDYGRDIVEIL